MLGNFFQDVRYAVRQLGKSMGFTTTAVVTLALAIGANAAIFSLVHAILLSNLPVTDPKTLVRLGNDNNCCVNFGASDEGNYTLFSLPTYEYIKKNAPEFEELAAIQAGFTFRPVTVRRDGNGESARSVMGEFVSGNYFRTFGLRPQAGRLFYDSDDVQGAPVAAVMSYEAWRRDYASDPSVVGTTFWVNTKAVTIVGVAPKGFYGDRLTSTPPDFYLPIDSMPELTGAPYVYNFEAHWIYMIGRVKPGVAQAALQQKVSALLRQAVEAGDEFKGDRGRELLAKAHITLTPGGAGIQQMQDDSSSALHLLMWVTGLVLLIACANIANLLLVRGMARKAEMSVRAALGAGRARLVRQLLTESLILAALGGLAGLFVAYASTRMLLTLLFPGAENVPISASPSYAVIGFAFGLTLVTSLLFGVAPAWISAQAEPADALRGARTTITGTSLLQRGLIVAQAALSVVLLVGAGLFAQSLHRLEGIDMKLDARNRYIVHINPQAAGYTQTQLEALYRTMEERFHEIPGVLKVGITSYTPMEDNNNGWSVQVQGQPDKNVQTSFLRVNADYFDSVGTHVVMGRSIQPRDTATAPVVAVVNQWFVDKLFKPGENPIGQHFGPSGPESSADFEIVGVVENTAYTDARWRDHPMCFGTLMQRPASVKKNVSLENDDSLYVGAIVVQTERPMNNMEVLARRTLSAINPNLAVVKFQTFDAQIADRFTGERLLARLTELFGALALLLAAVGLYGVTAYGVARRTQEIGIRMALGAERSGVVALVMRGALLQTVIGLAIGVPAAVLCVRFVESQLYEIKNADASVLVGSIATLAVATCVAGLIPAQRAASVQPQEALRHE